MEFAKAARALEAGRFDGRTTRALASLLGPTFARGLVRPERVPEAVHVVCVGGATLGGSGKTRVAMACAAFLASRGRRVVFVGHGYRGRLRAARVVGLDDPVAEVGDEALVSARGLPGVEVVVGPTRQAAIDLALRSSPAALVFDGPLALRSPGLSLLAVDARSPWGSGGVFPAGDLRAPRAALRALADHVVPVDATPARVRWGTTRSPLASLAGLDLGLFTAIARPERLFLALARSGIHPRVTVSIADHGRAPRLPSSPSRWIATEKCALHLAPGAGVGILEAELELPAAVQRALIGAP